MSLMNRPFGGVQPVTRGVFWSRPLSAGSGDGQPTPNVDTPMSTVVDTTPTCKFGRPSGNASSALMRFGMFDANTVCLSLVDAELSITNNRSRSYENCCVNGGPASPGAASDLMRGNDEH